MTSLTPTQISIITTLGQHDGWMKGHEINSALHSFRSVKTIASIVRHIRAHNGPDFIVSNQRLGYTLGVRARKLLPSIHSKPTKVDNVLTAKEQRKLSILAARLDALSTERNALLSQRRSIRRNAYNRRQYHLTKAKT